MEALGATRTFLAWTQPQATWNPVCQAPLGWGAHPAHSCCGLLPPKGELDSDAEYAVNDIHHRKCTRADTGRRTSRRSMLPGPPSGQRSARIHERWQFGEHWRCQNVSSFESKRLADGLAIAALFLSFAEQLSPHCSLDQSVCTFSSEIPFSRISLCPKVPVDYGHMWGERCLRTGVSAQFCYLMCYLEEKNALREHLIPGDWTLGEG